MAERTARLIVYAILIAGIALILAAPSFGADEPGQAGRLSMPPSQKEPTPIQEKTRAAIEPMPKIMVIQPWTPASSSFAPWNERIEPSLHQGGK